MVLMLGLFLFLYVGTESGYGSFIFTYAIKQVRMQPQDAAYLTALFWFSFAGGRLLGVPLSLRFSSTQLIFADLFGCIASLLAILIVHDSAPVLWVGTFAYGLSVASIYPSAINYAESHFSVTGRVLSVLVVSASLGEALVPLLMGLSFSSPTGPLGLILISMGVAVGAAVIFSIIVAVVAPTQRRIPTDEVDMGPAKEHSHKHGERRSHGHRKKTPSSSRRKKRTSIMAAQQHPATSAADSTLYSPAHARATPPSKSPGDHRHDSELSHAELDPSSSSHAEMSHSPGFGRADTIPLEADEMEL
jgi:hypothetical protein